MNKIRFLHAERLFPDDEEQRTRYVAIATELLQSATAMLLDELRTSGAPNYFATIFADESDGSLQTYELTLRRFRGKSPTQKLEDVEAEVRALQARVRQLEVENDELRASRST